MNSKKGNEESMFAGIVIFLVIFGIGIIVLAAGFDTVGTGKFGVLTRFGEPIGSMGPGMKWTGFFVSVTEFDLRIRKADLLVNTPEMAMSDVEMQDLYGSLQLNYVLNKDKIMSLFNDVARDDTEVESKMLLKEVMMKEFKDAAATYKADEWLLSRSIITEKVCKKLVDKFKDSYIEIKECVVTNTDVNPAYRAQIELQKVKEKEKITAEKEYEVQKIRNQVAIANTAAEAEKTVIAAKAENERKIIDAQAKAKEIELMGQAEATKIQLIGEAEGAALRAKKTETNQMLVDLAWIEAWKNGAAVPSWVTSENAGSFMMNIAGPSK